ncbi:MAG TPA: hypothetical protein VGA78_08270 [Gemmatimonadales bacterium]
MRLIILHSASDNASPVAGGGAVVGQAGAAEVIVVLVGGPAPAA